MAQKSMHQPGLLVAPLTPFTPDLQLDVGALRRQIDYVVTDCNATMVVAAGVEAQEYTYLSFDARKDLIRRTIDLVDTRRPVMVGISHPSFKIAIELANYAEKLGAAAVQVLAPLARPWRAAERGRSRRLFRGDQPRGLAADRALPQCRAGRRRLDPGDHRALAPAQGAIHQGKLARSCARVAADRGDRPCRPRPLLHHHADAAGDADARRLRRHHAAAGGRDRQQDRAGLCRRRSRQGGRAAIAVRAVSLALDALAG